MVRSLTESSQKKQNETPDLSKIGESINQSITVSAFARVKKAVYSHSPPTTSFIFIFKPTVKDSYIEVKNLTACHKVLISVSGRNSWALANTERKCFQTLLCVLPSRTQNNYLQKLGADGQKRQFSQNILEKQLFPGLFFIFLPLSNSRGHINTTSSNYNYCPESAKSHPFGPQPTLL